LSHVWGEEERCIQGFGVRRRGAYKVLVGKTERPLGRPRHR